MGPMGDTEEMFTTEVTEITENNHEKRERFGPSVGKLAGFAKKASQAAGNLWNGRVHAKIAELRERTQGIGVARSVEDISTIRIASFGTRSVRLTKWSHFTINCGVTMSRGPTRFQCIEQNCSRGL